jgi:tungstate ABC transporter binding protein WtpA
MLMRPLMPVLSLNHLFGIYCIGLFFQPAFPTVVGGDVVKVYYAGSLSSPFAKLEKAFEQAHPDVDVQLFSGGSGTIVDKVNKNGKFADVLASADYTLIAKNMVPKNATFYLNFAKNSMVLCYVNTSKYMTEINDKNWYQVLNREGVTYAISDPTSDPAGYRSLMTIKLAERYYGLSDIFNSLIGIPQYSGELFPDL